jgi:hypothetical protein
LTELTGLELDPYFVAPKLAWLRDTLTHDGVVGTTDAWLLQRLTGTFVTDVATASRTLLLDLDTVTWSDEAHDLFGLGDERRPELVANDAVIGSTTAFGSAGKSAPVGATVHTRENTTTFLPPPRLRRPVTVAPTAGPVLGGYLTEAVSWKALFLVNLVPGVLVCLATWRFVRVDEPDWSLLDKIDFLGIAYIVFFSLLAALSGVLSRTDCRASHRRSAVIPQSKFILKPQIFWY